MTPQQVQAILDQLAANLSGPAGQAFQLVVQRIVIESIVAICGGVVLLIATGAFWFGFWRVYRHVAAVQAAKEAAWAAATHSAYDSYRSDDWKFPFGVVGAIAGISSLFIVGGAALMIGAAVTDLLTPQYAALARLLGQVHP